ncbi:DUF2919 domain-containing protein [Enterovibrio sp. ZSDZ35]|uniref:DUF2919 domain-containing protein n=1 Tax=Enterovibrio qingdaonensis TaxID=2899818 RepID=A0ABT5QT63_9GAMM|nr:DUF2919 domain-containing protein [Enterovibrio sp. ZSDZ35]MDD1784165.1 DUF2919 domain-containing protein [Enterovibrio sp. ZSDZ35]
MKTLYQSPDYYDKHGNAKPNLMFWLSCIYLAKSWVVFVIAGVSREQGQTLLSLFYPHHDALYIGLGIGFPAVALMLMAGNIHRYPPFLEKIWRKGKGILVGAFVCDLILQIKHLIAQQWAFHWSGALTLLIAIWLVSYLFRSRRIQFLFEAPITREEK